MCNKAESTKGFFWHLPFELSYEKGNLFFFYQYSIHSVSDIGFKETHFLTWTKLIEKSVIY